MPALFRRLLCIALVSFLGATHVHATDMNASGVLDKPFPYISFDQDIRDALGEFVAANNLALDMADDVRGRFRGRAATSTGRQLLDNASRLSRSVWYFDGHRIVIRKDSPLSIRRFGLAHVKAHERMSLVQNLKAQGPGAVLTYDASKHDLVVHGVPEYIEAVAATLKGVPAQRAGPATVHRFSTQ